MSCAAPLLPLMLASAVLHAGQYGLRGGLALGTSEVPTIMDPVVNCGSHVGAAGPARVRYMSAQYR